MTRVTAVLLPGPFAFVAYVFRGDADEPERVWICVRSKEPSMIRSWLGCWSSKQPLSSGEVEEMVVKLAQRIQESAEIGPQGPHLGGYHFIAGWDSWGIGNPGPIVDEAPDQTMRENLTEVPLAEFRFEE